MHKSAFEGIGIKVCAFAGAAGFNQQLVDARQHRQVLLAGEQGFQRL